MRGSTEIIIGIRNVGAQAEEPIIESMTAQEAVKRIAMYIVESSFARRFQISIARSHDEVMVGLGLSKTNQDAKRTERAREVTDYIDSLFGGDAEDDAAPAGGQQAEQESDQ